MKNNHYKLRLCAFFWALVASIFTAGAQTHPNTPIQLQITGTVTDAAGPLPGVHIAVQGQQRGTFTDREGYYQLSAAPQDVLVYTYLGYMTETREVGTQSQIDVVMQENVTALQEVEVNAGYYTVKERERTGNISKVTGEEIGLQPVVNPLQAIQGRMPGVIMTQNSNIPGSAGSIQIRGRNSLRTEGNYPLYIVDGVPINSTPITPSGGLLRIGPGIDPLNTLNLNNIASIEVLKDADATAIYGSRGANGVVLITTKTGALGQTKFSISNYNGAGRASNRYNLLTTPDYLAMRQEAFANSGATPSVGNAPDLLLWDPNRYTDWQSELLGHTAYIQDTQLSLSAGDAHSSFVLGGSYHKEDMIFPGDFGYRKFSGNFNYRHTSNNQRFSLQLAANYGVDRNKSIYETQFIESAILLPPNAPALYTESEALNWEGSSWINPMSALEKKQEVETNNLIVNTALDYELAKGLKFKTSFGYSNLFSREYATIPLSSSDPAIPAINSAQELLTQRYSWVVEPQLHFAKTWGKHQLDVLLGLTYQKSNDNTKLITGQGFTDDSLIYNLDAAEAFYLTFQNDFEYAYQAVFGRVGYNFDETYFINLTGRRDGSSRFGPNRRFSNFGAIGAAWIFSEEMKNLAPFFSFGKVRGSYGTTGSDQIADYGYYDTYSPTEGPNGLYPTQLANPDYSWEVNKKLEVALDLGFFKDRLMFLGSWYKNRSSNQLVGYSLPAITGFTSIQANLPATVENTGWELQLSAQVFQKKKLSWDSSVHITLPKNKLVAFDGIENSSYANTYRVGESLGIALLYESLGVNAETGLYEVADVNEDNVYNFDDRVLIQNLDPKLYGGLNNTLTVHNFSLNFFAEFVQQQGRNELDLFYTPGYRAQNQPVSVLDRWQLEGQQAYMQKFSTAGSTNTAYNRNALSDMSITDASYLRLKTISLSYTVAQEPLKRVGLQGCTLFIHGQNLWTITGYRGLDPHSARVGNLNFLPPLRTITLGIKLEL